MNTLCALLFAPVSSLGCAAPLPPQRSPELTLPEGAKVLFELKDEHPDHFGMGFLALGDVDRDGVSDFYVGARSGVQGLCTGQGYGDVFSGRTGKLIYRIESDPEPEGNYFGCSVVPIADLDGDGITEIGINGEHVAAWACYSQIRSGRDGKLVAEWEGRSIVLDARDQDGDGRRDVVVTGEGGIGFVSPGGTKLRQFTGKPALSARTGDLDQDGVRDFLCVPEFSSDGIRVCSGRDGAALVALCDTSEWDGVLRSTSAIGDADGDGFVDVLVTCYEQRSSTRSWPASERRFRRVLLSGKDGHVLRDRWEELPSPGDLHWPVDLGDVDGDGCSDLLVAQSLHLAAARVRIESGKDGSALLEIVGGGPSLGQTAASVGDLDGDGVPEIALGEHEFGNCAGRALVISPGKSVRKR